MAEVEAIRTQEEVRWGEKKARVFEYSVILQKDGQ